MSQSDLIHRRRRRHFIITIIIQETRHEWKCKAERIELNRIVLLADGVYSSKVTRQVWVDGRSYTRNNNNIHFIVCKRITTTSRQTRDSSPSTSMRSAKAPSQQPWGSRKIFLFSPFVFGRSHYYIVKP